MNKKPRFPKRRCGGIVTLTKEERERLRQQQEEREAQKKRACCSGSLLRRSSSRSNNRRLRVSSPSLCCLHICQVKPNALIPLRRVVWYRRLQVQFIHNSSQVNRTQIKHLRCLRQTYFRAASCGYFPCLVFIHRAIPLFHSYFCSMKVLLSCSKNATIQQSYRVTKQQDFLRTF
jgi:hypothetical protein